MTMSNVIVKNILLLAMLIFSQVKADTSVVKENDQIKHLTYNFLRHYSEASKERNNFSFKEIQSGFEVRTAANTVTHLNKQIVTKGEVVFQEIFETYFIRENPDSVMALRNILERYNEDKK